MASSVEFRGYKTLLLAFYERFISQSKVELFLLWIFCTFFFRQQPKCSLKSHSPIRAWTVVCIVCKVIRALLFKLFASSLFPPIQLSISCIFLSFITVVLCKLSSPQRRSKFLCSRRIRNIYPTKAKILLHLNSCYRLLIAFYDIKTIFCVPTS